VIVVQRSKGLRKVECCNNCWWIYAEEKRTGDKGCKFYTTVAPDFKCKLYQNMSQGSEPFPSLKQSEKKWLRDKPDVWD
jgi:hypothetical protein